jgi:hypothetical protein
MHRRLRRAPLFAAALACAALTACSAQTPQNQDPASAKVQGGTTAVKCGGVAGGGPVKAWLVDFDASSQRLFAFTTDGTFVDTRFDDQTALLIADLSLWPPDPIFPQCRDEAAVYDRVAGDGFSQGVRDAVGVFAQDFCSASLVIGADGTLASFQPVP